MYFCWNSAPLGRCCCGVCNSVPKFLRLKNSVFYSPIPADVLSMANFTLEFTTPFLDFSDSVLQTQQCTHDSSVIKREFLCYLLLSFASTISISSSPIIFKALQTMPINANRAGLGYSSCCYKKARMKNTTTMQKEFIIIGRQQVGTKWVYKTYICK